MKPVLKTSSLSLAFALAALSGCQGGASTGHTDTQNSTFRHGLPPTLRDADKLALTDTNVDYMLALRSAALKLTGNYPTAADIQKLQNSQNQAADYATIIDGYLNSPAFASMQVSFWRNTMKIGAGETVGTPAAMNDCAPTFAASLVAGPGVGGAGQDFRRVLTATTDGTGKAGTCPTLSNGVFTPGEAPAQTGIPVTGVLTDKAVMAQFMSSMAFRRGRWVQETFMCVRFPAETGTPPVSTPSAPAGYVNPWPWNSITGDDPVVSPAVAPINFLVRDGLICANCHATLNHIAPLFGKFDTTGAYVMGSAFKVPTPIATPRDSIMSDWLPAGETTAWRWQKPVADLPALAQAITADPGFGRCMATRVWNWAMSRGDVVNEGSVLTDALANPMAAAFVADNYNMKNMIRRVFNDPNYVRY